MVLVQKWPFFELFFSGNIIQENVFYDILERKKGFLGYKNKKFKNSKNWLFLNGLTHGFCAKMAIFSTFFFREDRPGKCLLRYSRRKKTLSRLKKYKKLKKSKNWHFSKGVNPWFWLTLVQHRVLKVIIIHSKYFPDSDWLKADVLFTITSYWWPNLEEIWL